MVDKIEKNYLEKLYFGKCIAKKRFDKRVKNF